MIVVDANLIGYFFLSVEHAPLSIKVFENDPDWYAPFLWRSEVRNILTNYLRRKLLTLDEAQAIIAEAHNLMADREQFVSSSQVLALAAVSGCTAYDCEYVAAARELGFKLVTFDKEVVRAFPETAIFPDSFQ